jgi:hypothetical protein
LVWVALLPLTVQTAHLAQSPQQVVVLVELTEALVHLVVLVAVDHQRLVDQEQVGKALLVAQVARMLVLAAAAVLPQ